MSTIVKFNNKVLRLNNKTVGWTVPIPPPVLYHVTTNGVNGTVVATPNTGYNGDTITLSNTPDEGYEFDSYSLTGATLYDTNKFDINNSDVNVVGNFIEFVPEPVYINPDRIVPGTYSNYAVWYKSQLTNAGGTYNSTYKFVSDNWTTGLNNFYGEFWTSNGDLASLEFAYKSNNYEFNLSSILTETQFNNLDYFIVYAINASHGTEKIPSDIKLQLLS